MKYSKRLICTLAFLLSGCGEAQMEWACEETSPSSLQCSIANHGTVAGEICMDIVVVCEDGEHSTHFCSGVVGAGEVKQRVVSGFKPDSTPFHPFKMCHGMEYRNEVISIK